MNKFNSKQHNYYTLDSYFKERFGKKVFKVALNASFTCPNRDGTKSTKGCFFCSSKGSGDFAGNKNDTLKEQFNKIKDILSLKWNDALYIPYFQAYSNTYKDVLTLERLYNEAININNNIVALSIATRPDCINEENASLLGIINKQKPVIVELGLQTIHDKTMKNMNLCYTLDDFEKAIFLLNKNNIEIVVHIINGLPYESKEMMIETVKYLSNQNINGIKIHSLFILKNTELEKIYNREKFHVLTQEEYVDITILQLRYLKSDIVIHRINGDAPKDELIEPLWSLKKFVVMNEIDKKMKANNYFQGDLWKK